MRDPEGIRDLVAKAVGSLGLGDLAAAGRLLGSWEEIVGPEVAARSQPLSLREGVLRIQTDSPAWAAEVRYLAPELLRRTNAALGRELARELQVSLKPPGGDAQKGYGRSPGGAGRKGYGGSPDATGRWRGSQPREPGRTWPQPAPQAEPSPRPRADPSARPPAKLSVKLPIRDQRLADAVSRVLDAARANRRDNKGGKRAQ